jgi:pectinesterase
MRRVFVLGSLILAGIGYRTALSAETNLFVAADGSAQFKTVQEAVMAVPAGSATNPVVIHIKPGVYKELIYVQHEKRFFRFVGEDAEKTMLTYDLNANLKGLDGKPIGTFRTPSTTIDADDFRAENVTFENSAGPVGQALAIRVDGDRVAFRNCRFLGWQDTILANRGRHYFEECYITGHVDFIFGAATAFFEKCHIHCLKKGYITAASTPENQPFGFVFSNCKITGESEVQTYLGRPWRAFASVTFLNTEMSDVVCPEGWDNWRDPAREKTARYAEFNSTRPGANPQARVPWSRQLTEEEAKAVTVGKVLGSSDGWNPKMEQTCAAVPAKTPPTGDAASTNVTTSISARQADEPAATNRAAKVRIVLAGDSTVTTNAGWGAGFAKCIATTAECINLSLGGRSSKSFIAEGLWKKCLELKPDYILIQFGHNDQPGHGPDRETDPQTTYRQFMTQYVDDAKAAGIQPVLITSLSRRQWGDDGKIHSRLQPNVDVVKEIATEKRVPLIDLHARSIELYEKLGKDGCNALSPRKGEGYDGTHLNAKGSDLIGPIVAEELKKAVPNLAPYIK